MQISSVAVGPWGTHPDYIPEKGGCIGACGLGQRNTSCGNPECINLKNCDAGHMNHRVQSTRHWENLRMTRLIELQESEQDGIY